MGTPTGSPGGRLTICLPEGGAKRPKAFEPKEGLTVITLTRERG